MSDSSPYRRYVVVQVRSYRSYGAGPCWHDRCATAADGFRSLEARIAEEYLDTGSRPQIALVDCREGRVLAASLADAFASSLVGWASRYAVVEPSADIALDVAPGAAQEPTTTELGESRDDEDETEELELQRLIDAVVATFLAGALDKELFDELCDRLEEDDDFHCGSDEAHVAVARHTLAFWLGRVLEEGEYRDLLDIPDREPIGEEHLIRLMTEHGLPALLDDADRCEAFAPRPISDSAGRTIVVVSSVRGYSFSGVEVTWHGAHSSWQAFLDGIRGEWFSCPAEILALTEDEKLALIESAMDM